jgi:RimJ/RimL family protein N-acetyltransferase
VAQKWILTHRDDFEKDKAAIFAVTLKPDGTFIGAVGLSLESEHSRAELGYWIGKPFWDLGYATEAARAVISYGFRQLGLNRIHARCFSFNKASAHVLEKLGMTHEGHLRKHILQWGEFEDIEVFGILKSEFIAKSK